MNLQQDRAYQRYKQLEGVFNKSLNSYAKVLNQIIYDFETKGPFEATRVAILNAKQQEQSIEDGEKRLEEMKGVEKAHSLIESTCQSISELEESEDLASSEQLEDIGKNLDSIEESLKGTSPESKDSEKLGLQDIEVQEVKRAFQQKNVPVLQDTKKKLQLLQKKLPYQELEAAKEEMEHQLRDARMLLQANLYGIDYICEKYPKILETDYSEMQRVQGVADLTNHAARNVAKYAISQQTGLPPDAVEAILRQAAQQDEKQKQLFLQKVAEIRDMGMKFLEPLMGASQVEESGNEPPSLEELSEAVAGYLKEVPSDKREKFIGQLQQQLKGER